MTEKKAYREYIEEMLKKRQAEAEEEAKSLLREVIYIKDNMFQAQPILERFINKDQTGEPVGPSSLWMLDNIGDRAWQLATKKTKVDLLLKEVDVLKGILFDLDHRQGN